MKKVDLNIRFEKPKKAQHYITGLLKYMNDEFDQYGVAKSLVEKYFNDSSSKYYQMSVEDIVKQWTETGQRAIFIGNALDDYVGLVTEPEKQKLTMGEWSKKVNFSTDEAIYKRIDVWEKYWKWLEDNGWEMIGREVPLFYVINGRLVGGRADMIVYNRRMNNITIIDWKTADEIQKDRWTKQAHGPVDGLYQDKATGYGMQVSFYKIALRKILPEELKDVTIDTCIVQVCSSGQILRTKNNITLSEEDIIKILAWCIDEDKKAKGQTVEEQTSKTEVFNPEPTFEQELEELLNKHGWDTKCDTPDFILAKYIINTLNNYKDAIQADIDWHSDWKRV